ncbi:MAG: response regulator [Aestuariibacter sp.]
MGTSNKLVLAFISAVLLPTAVISYLMFQQSQQQSKNNFLLSTEREVRQIDSSLYLLFQQIAGDVDYLAGHSVVRDAHSDLTNYLNVIQNTLIEPEKGSKTEQRLYQLFDSFGSTHPDITYIYFGNVEGGYVQWPAGEVFRFYDPRKRPWYVTGQKANGETVRTDAYYWVTDDTVIVSTVKALYDDFGQSIGVIGMDMSLQNMTNVIKEIKVGASGYVMLIGIDGKVLVDPKKPENNFQPIEQIYEGQLAQANAMQSGQQIITIDGVNYLVSVYLSPRLGWKLMGLIEESEIIGAAEEQLEINAVITLIWLFIFIVFAVILSRVISQQIASKEHQLIAEKEKAQAAVVAKGEFLANMSHEIRTPMNGVLGMLSLLLDSKLSQQQSRYARLAQSSAESLLDLINDILDFSKVEAGKIELEVIDFDVRQLFEDATETLAHRADEKKLELILDTAGLDIQWVKGDPGRIRQILNNLVGNAIKFTSSGEVVVRVQTEKADDDKVVLSTAVQDTGVGIPKGKIAELFKSFTQVDTSTTRNFGGSGLGLAIVKQLCDLMQGTIAVDSELDVGSTFSITITLDQGEVKVKPKERIDIRGKQILIVDDNATNREVLRKQLENWGAEVAEASDGIGALKVMRRNPDFDLAILDMHMPGMDGASLGKMVRDEALLSRIPLIMMTSIGDAGDKHYFEQIGFQAYFAKPVTGSDLYDGVIAVLLGQQMPESKPPIVTLDQLRYSKDMSESKASILLVEDNMINQEVAKGMITRLGYKVDCANDGLQALDMLNDQGNKYEIVFMDCQMPRMDGYAATKAVRNSDSEHYNSAIPIIAMTANAMKGDKEKCLAAGMDDYLSKPVSAKEIKEKLEIWMSISERVNGGEEVELSPTKESNIARIEAPNEQQWDHRGFMERIGNSQTLATRLITMFKEAIPAEVARMQNHLNEDALGELSRLAHKIKGSSGSLGAVKVSRIAQELEDAGRQDNKPLSVKLFKDLQDSVDDFLAVLP